MDEKPEDPIGEAELEEAERRLQGLRLDERARKLHERIDAGGPDAIEAADEYVDLSAERAELDNLDHPPS